MKYKGFSMKNSESITYKKIKMNREFLEKVKIKGHKKTLKQQLLKGLYNFTDPF